MNTRIEVKGQFIYEADTRRYHKFQVETEGGIVIGTLYIPKKTKPLPQRIVLEYMRKQ